MPYNFDAVIDRRASDSLKWRQYGPDVLPLWVADMDFVSPEPVVNALSARVAHGVFGYAADAVELREVVIERLSGLYGWHVAPEAVIFVPGVVTGFNLVAGALTRPGDGLLIQTPVYPPILHVAGHHGLVQQENELVRMPDGHYGVDLAAFESAITAVTRMFLLCNPHNPVGRVFSREELEAMAEICLRHDLLICSDEIHCDLLFPGGRHTPVATLGPEVARRTVTLLAPSKTYNIAGLHCSVLIVDDPELRAGIHGMHERREETVGSVNALGLVAALAAYRGGDPWLAELLAYLSANRDFVLDSVRRCLPGVSAGPIEATYLAWLDCRLAGIPGVPYKFFLKEARVALSDGRAFGRGGEGFVRLNFGCPRSLLAEGLEKMSEALRGVARQS